MGKKKSSNSSKNNSSASLGKREKEQRETEEWYQLVAFEGLILAGVDINQNILESTTNLVRLNSQKQEILQIQPMFVGNFDENNKFWLSRKNSNWIYIYSLDYCTPYSKIMDGYRKTRIVQKIGK